MTTTAVSFRKGNTEENDAFAGVKGEIVADLGANSEVTENATIILHTGNGQAGGIRMARQDLNNITYDSINNLANFKQESGHGTYYGLLRRNMSNYTTNDVNASTVESALKSDYHIASQDGHDLDTGTYIAGPDGNSGPVSRSAGGKYLLNRDLSNLHSDGEVKVVKSSYKYWLNNVDTSFLAGEPYIFDSQTYSLLHGNPLAYANMTNVDTGILAGDSGSHIGADLAYKNLSNVGYHTIVAYLDSAYDNNEKLQDYEWIERKNQTINPYEEADLSEKYPSVQAVINYTASVGQDYTNRYLDNVQTWDIASQKEDMFKIKIAISNGGSGYSLPKTFQTGIAHPDGGQINIVVRRVSSTGKILEVSTETGKEYSSATVTQQPYADPDGTATFIISSESVKAGNLMLANLRNSTISSANQGAAVSYNFTEGTGGVITVIDSVSGALNDATTSTSGTFAVNRAGNNETSTKATISVTDLSANPNTKSSIVVTKNNAYLNKSVTTETQNANDQLLNRGEMDARYQLQPSTAVQDNIAIFNSAKSTVDSGKAFTTNVANSINTASNDKIPTEYAVRDAIEEAVTRAVVYKGTVNTENDLPTSGQTNGDLYWIRAFSNNPPTGMTPGHSGTAIWNANLATPTWDYKEDTRNDPDGTSIELNSSGKLTVMLSATAANAITKNNDGLYVNANSFVPSSGYVAVAAVSGQSGKVLTNNGTNTSWRTATPEPPTTQGIYHLVVDAQGNATWVNDRRLSLDSATE